MFRLHIAFDDKTAVGYCVSTAVLNGIGEIESLFIDEKFRGQGIGDVFLRSAMEWMDQSLVRTKKITVYAGNEGVIKFYQNFQFYPKHQVLEYKEMV